MSVIVSLAARKESRSPDVSRRRLPDGRGAQVVILPCIRREAIGEGARAGRAIEASVLIEDERCA